MSDFFKDKVILLTGGTGSFGNKFVEMILKQNPKAIRIYSRNELKQIDMERDFTNNPGFNKLRFFIGDVRDETRLSRAMNNANVVIHAAALKHVPICEYNPIEAVKTNIDGAKNVINAAIDNEVSHVMALSTDKAVNPVNLYGATKMVAEKLFIQANAYSGKSNTRFSCVRYGNVIGSSGSVVPVFLKQKESGEISITDERMTRFWITLDEGVNLVANGLKTMKGGEIFIPKIPSIKITDLAEVLAPTAKKKVTGIRPGEKIHEVLLTSEESRHSRDMGSNYVIEPEQNFWGKTDKSGKDLKDGFTYSSDNNDVWLNQSDIRKLLVKEGWLKS